MSLWWSEAKEVEDLRELAEAQVEKLKNMKLDFELSNNHPDRIAYNSFLCDDMIKETNLWLNKPRVDHLEQLESEPERKPWPIKLIYEQKHAARNARLFLTQRPNNIISSDSVLYSFNDGIWTGLSDKALETEIRETDPSDFLDVDNVRKMVHGVHQLSAVEQRPFEWLDQPTRDLSSEGVVLFRNGLFDFKNSKLIPHNGSYFATGLPDHDFNPVAECPTWMNWLNETLDPEFHETLQEWFGYCLIPDIRAHRFMTFVGKTRSGKSTAHNVLCDLIGSQHIASSMMSDLSGSFGLENFLDKRLVVVPDANDNKRGNNATALERLKSITGGDEVSVNRKNIAMITARLKARVLITCNQLPKFVDESGALAARMLIIRFESSFLGKEDRYLGARLKQEASGIANWAIMGLYQLLDNDYRFTECDKGKDEVKIAARAQSPALRFAEECLSVTGKHGDFTPMSEIYSTYQYWGPLEEGLSSVDYRNQTELMDDLVAALDGVKRTQRRIAKRPVYGLSGVSNVLDPRT
ncbi:MAG: phage/plasmid primase, P4 family [Pseudomonadota bacterium]